VPRFLVEDVRCQLHHLLGHARGRDAFERLLLIAHLIVVAQRGAEQPLAPRLNRHDVLAFGKHDARQRHPPLVLHGIADGEGFLAAFAVRHDVIGTLMVSLTDLLLRYEGVDVDGMRALDLDGFQLLGFDLDVLAHGPSGPYRRVSRSPRQPSAGAIDCPSCG
jgi:hypothetical protein